MAEALTLPDRYNAAVDFVDEAPAPDGKAAFIDRTGTHTYGELKDLVDRAGGALQSLGLRSGDRVAMAMLDTIDFPAVFWGAVKAGLVPVCLNTLLTAESYDYILRDCGATALVVSAELLAAIEPVLAAQPHLERVVVAGDAGGDVRLGDLIDAAPSGPTVADSHRDDVAFFLYSSGSTGEPKGVMHRHGSLAQTAHLYGAGILGIEPDDVVYSAAKLFFAYGLGNAMTFPLSVGATAVLLDTRPTPDAVMGVMAEHQVSMFFGVPTLYAALLSDEANTRAAGSKRLRRCVSAGEALPEPIGKAWEDRFGVEILDGIGSTEMLHIFISNSPGDVRYGWSGRPVPGYAARIVDETGTDVPPGELGELLINGPSAAAGYRNLSEKTAETFVEGWTHTGDKYSSDGDGFYLYGGRTDDMFKVGGNWVSPFEVESAIADHPDVLEAAVIAKPDEAGNMKPKAYVVTNPSTTPSDALAESIQDHVRDRLEPWKYPRWIELTAELPKTATGKTQRFKLRERDRKG